MSGQMTSGATAPHIRAALKFVKGRGSVTADELVEWDRSHGRHLFTWDDTEAAEDWRRHEARMFLNRFRAVFDGMRVRAFIHVREDEQADIDESGYVSVEAIAKHSGMREQVIGDITRRMQSLASELRMWNLSDAEQAALFARLAAAIRSDLRATRRQHTATGAASMNAAL